MSGVCEILPAREDASVYVPKEVYAPNGAGDSKAVCGSSSSFVPKFIADPVDSLYVYGARGIIFQFVSQVFNM